MRLSGVRMATPDLCMHRAKDPCPFSVAYYRVDLSGIQFTCNRQPIRREWTDLKGQPQVGVLSPLPELRRALPGGASAAMQEVAVP